GKFRHVRNGWRRPALFRLKAPESFLPACGAVMGMPSDAVIAAGDGPKRAFWPAAAGIVSVAIGEFVLGVVQLGPVASHMGAHILLMIVGAPFLALAALGRFPPLARRFSSGRALLAGSFVQVAMLWAWHAPASLAFS